MVYKLISSKEVLSKILSDLDMEQDIQRISDYIEWIGEAVEKIGAVTQLDRVVSGVDGADVLQIVGHQAKMPCDLFRLNQVAYGVNPDGPWFPMVMATGTFNMWKDSPSNPTNNDTPYIQDDVLIGMVKILYEKYVNNPIYSWFSKMDYNTALSILNTNQNARTLLTNLVKNGTSYADKKIEDVKYSIKPGYIVCNMPTGYIKLSYDAIPTDEDGYPMIPDLASYKEAIMWYVTMKLKYPEYLNGRMNREIYYDIKRSWNYYSKQAYGDAMMPNIDMMESIGRTWNRMIPELDARNEFYDSLSNRQYVRSNNRR